MAGNNLLAGTASHKGDASDAGQLTRESIRPISSFFSKAFFFVRNSLLLEEAKTRWLILENIELEFLNSGDFFFRKSVLCSLRLFFLSNRVEGSRGKFYQCVYLEELIN